MGTLSLFYDYNGQKMTLNDLAALAEVPYGTMYRRMVLRNMTPEEAVGNGKDVRKRAIMYDVGGEMLTLDEMSERSGVSRTTLYERLNRGETPEKAMMSAETRKLEQRRRSYRMRRWYDRAFELIYPASEAEALGLRELSPGNWGWTSEHFIYMASRLGKSHMLLRAWWRINNEPAMLRLYIIIRNSGEADAIVEIADKREKIRVLEKWGLRG